MQDHQWPDHLSPDHLSPDHLSPDHSLPDAPSPDPLPVPRSAPRSTPFWPRRSLGIALGLSAIALMIGGGSAWWHWHSSQLAVPVSSNAVQPTENQTNPPNPPNQTVPVEQTVQVYWLKDVNNQLELASGAIAVTDNQPNAVLQAAFAQMLKGPTDPDLVSTIPAGTTLRRVEVKADGVHVDLSSEFTSGGGSASMMGRVAQVIYTATTLNPEAPVWLSVDGKPLEVLGGEGLLLDQPMTRQSFEENFQL